MPTTEHPTRSAYASLEAAFDRFNRDLFDGALPRTLITLQRHARAYGYFSGERFARVGGQDLWDEIAMNPLHFDRPARDILSTLAHEMAHEWQKHFGKEPSRCYHDRQWAAKMKEIGLHPSSTGEPGGKETGPKVSHYIVESGRFAASCDAFLKEHEPAFYRDRAAILKARGKKGGDGDDDGDGDGEEKSTGRAKFTCPGCKLNAWAKPSALLLCMTCDRPMLRQDG